MKLSVKLFAAARDRAGSENLQVELPDRASVRELRAALGAACPGLMTLLPQLWIAVNEEYASDDAALSADSRVACFPPVSGG